MQNQPIQALFSPNPQGASSKYPSFISLVLHVLAVMALLSVRPVLESGMPAAPHQVYYTELAAAQPQIPTPRVKMPRPARIDEPQMPAPRLSAPPMARPVERAARPSVPELPAAPEIHRENLRNEPNLASLSPRPAEKPSRPVELGSFSQAVTTKPISARTPSPAAMFPGANTTAKVSYAPVRDGGFGEVAVATVARPTLVTAAAGFGDAGSSASPRKRSGSAGPVNAGFGDVVNAGPVRNGSYASAGVVNGSGFGDAASTGTARKGSSASAGVVNGSGFGDAASTGKARKGSSATAGPVNSGAFGDAAPRIEVAEVKPVQSGGFQSAQAVTASKPTAGPSEQPLQSQVSILDKPRPSYTEEARRLKIEGEVVLEIRFCASGEARVVRIVRGLGHGLDENAVRAAEAIRFRPALRGGAPVDQIAEARITFQLAY